MGGMGGWGPGVTARTWVVEGEPGPLLVRLYFSIALCVLVGGLYATVRVSRHWLLCYQRATVLIQSYVWITAADAATVFIYCFLAVSAIIHPNIPSKS